MKFRTKERRDAVYFGPKFGRCLPCDMHEDNWKDHVMVADVLPRSHQKVTILMCYDPDNSRALSRIIQNCAEMVNQEVPNSHIKCVWVSVCYSRSISTINGFLDTVVGIVSRGQDPKWVKDYDCAARRNAMTRRDALMIDFSSSSMKAYTTFTGLFFLEICAIITIFR